MEGCSGQESRTWPYWKKERRRWWLLNMSSTNVCNFFLYFFLFLCDKMDVRRHEINSPGGKLLLRRQSDVSSCESTCCFVVDTQASLEREADKIMFASWEFSDWLPVRCCVRDTLCVTQSYYKRAIRFSVTLTLWRLTTHIVAVPHR